MASGTFGYRLGKGDPGQVKIEGLREVNKALRDLGDDTKNEMKATHLEAARIVLPEAIRLAPMRTGQMAHSLVATATRTGGRITSKGVPYVGPIHFGWPSRRIKPQPFVYEALDPRRDEVVDIYVKRMNHLIEKYGIAADKAGNVFAGN